MKVLKWCAVLMCTVLVSGCWKHVGNVQAAGDVLAVTSGAVKTLPGADQSDVARAVLEVNGLVQGTRAAVTVGCAMVLTGTDDGPSLFDRLIDPLARYCAEREAVFGGTSKQQAGRFWGASGPMFAKSSMKTNGNAAILPGGPD